MAHPCSSKVKMDEDTLKCELQLYHLGRHTATVALKLQPNLTVQRSSERWITGVVQWSEEHELQ